MGHWTPPSHTHGLIREYIVSVFQAWTVQVGVWSRFLGLCWSRGMFWVTRV